MASPQAENGHSRINHESLEHLVRLHLNGTQWDLIMCVIRRTWGFNKKSDYISLSQFLQMTGRHRNSARKELSILIESRILTVLEPATFSRPACWMFNKDWEEWRYIPVAEVRSSVPGTPKRTAQGHCSVPAQGHCSVPTKETLKETLQKKEKSPSDSFAPSPKTDSPLPCYEITLPLNDRTVYKIPLADVDFYRTLYPAVDVDQAIRNMRGWCDSHPKKLKTRNGIKAFITTWLKGDQDKGGTSCRSPGSNGNRQQELAPRTQRNLGAAERWLRKHEEKDASPG